MTMLDDMHDEMHNRIEYLESVLAAVLNAGYYPPGVEPPPPSEVLRQAGFGPENHL